MTASKYQLIYSVSFPQEMLLQVLQVLLRLKLLVSDWYHVCCSGRWYCKTGITAFLPKVPLPQYSLLMVTLRFCVFLTVCLCDWHHQLHMHTVTSLHCHGYCSLVPRRCTHALPVSWAHRLAHSVLPEAVKELEQCPCCKNQGHVIKQRNASDWIRATVSVMLECRAPSWF